MKTIWNVLNKTLVVEFYRQNAGFLFLVILFGFGFLRPEDHIALMRYVFASPFLLVLLWAIWGLYHFKTIWFVQQRLGLSSHSFLYNLVLVSRFERWLLLVLAQFSIWLPVVMYAIFVGYYGWQFGQYMAVISTAIFLITMPLSALCLYEYRLFRPNPDKRLGVVNTYFNRRFAKPYCSFFLLHLLKVDTVSFFLTKTFTVGITVGLCLLYPTDNYDQRRLSLGALLIGVAHASILLHLYEFEHLQLPILRNLPLSQSQRFGQYMLLFLLLLLPETVVLLRYLPVALSYGYAMQWWAFTLSMCSLIFGRFLQKHYVVDDLLRHSFYFFIVGFFAIMFRIPIFVFTVINFLVGIWLCVWFYYSGEYLVRD
jgi:hypothetical protein